MQATIRVLAVLIAVVALSPHSYAQTIGNGLEGIKGVSMDVIFNNDEGARACGVTEEGLRSAAAFPIVTSRLKLLELGQAYLSIGVTVVPLTEGGCAASYKVEVSVIQLTMLELTKLTKVTEILLWDSGGLLLGPSGTFGTRMSEAVECLAKEFVVDWTLDQQ